MYYIYGISGPSLLIESTDSMIIVVVVVVNFIFDRYAASTQSIGFHAGSVIILLCLYICMK